MAHKCANREEQTKYTSMEGSGQQVYQEKGSANGGDIEGNEETGDTANQYRRDQDKENEDNNDSQNERLPRRNFAIVCRLILDVCSNLLRDVLRVITEPNTPNTGFARTDDNLDLTALYNLCTLRNAIQAHGNQWGHPPNERDVSLSANIEQIRILRDESAFHLSSASVNTSDFEGIINKITDCIREIQQAVPAIETKYLNEMDRVMNENLTLDMLENVLERFRQQFSILYVGFKMTSDNIDERTSQTEVLDEFVNKFATVVDIDEKNVVI